MSKSLILRCPACGKVHRKHQGWSGGDYCCRECYLSMPFPLHPHIQLSDVRRVARMHSTQLRAAEALGVSYPQFVRAVKKLGIRDQFAQRGAASWVEA